IIDGIKMILSRYDNIEVVGFSTNGKKALTEAEVCEKIDIFIIDINLPDIDGLLVMSDLKIRFPEAKFIVLSMHNNKNIIRNAFQKGIMGYVLKNAGEEDLIEAIGHANDGKKFVSSDVIPNIIESFTESEPHDDPALLTDREITIAKLTAKGHTSGEIAAVLFISPRTVETHRRNIMHKLGLRGHSELIKYAIQSGWIDI
ncbi:MAG: response regulator transcription factor, partial [Candidatus Kapabacteria bacterium]|nr:response regulator transcription factor [Candidatus Kapabacteria bacterium]